MRPLQNPWKILSAATLLAVAGMTVPGCGGPSGADLCDAQADCELWSVPQVNACYASADSDDFIASRTPCGPFLDDLRACEDATGFCAANREWDTSCKFERDRWHSCTGK